MSDAIVPQGEQDNDVALYEQWDNEDDAWYFRFFDFYARLGIGRTLRHAYLLHNEWMTEKGDGENCPSYDKWREHARSFRWKKRAELYDQAQAARAAQMVREASIRLQEASVEAVEALKTSLKNTRTRVSGAKAILDRGGLPPVKEVKHTVEPFRADELAQASEEIEAWEKQMRGSSGSNVLEA